MQVDLTPRPALPAVESTYKAREVEGWIDIHFYRKLGLPLANFFRILRMTPTMVTLLGGVFGVIAGHFYYYRDLRTNVIGMLLHVFANLLDNADGQLARLTNSGSRTGRVVDSVVDHIIFINIYVHLGLRCLSSHGFFFVLFLTCAAGLSHALQAAAADYYRNGYLHFGTGRSRGDMDSSAYLRAEFQALRWRDRPWHKFLLAVYLNFTRQQEMLAPNLARLRDVSDDFFYGAIPEWFQKRYHQWAKPMFKWWSGLMTNTRMLVLFVCLSIGRPMWFFWFELTVLNFLLVWLLLRQESMSKSLLAFTTERQRV
jgi:phosphatidylglycerophosphate synthase